MVKMILPLHSVHLPMRGGRRNFSLQPTQRNSWVENLRRLPLVSLRKCFSMTRRATSELSTERSFSAMFIWPKSFSCIEGSVLYALHLTVWLMLVESWVNPIFSYWRGVARCFLMVGTFASHAGLYASAAS